MDRNEVRSLTLSRVPVRDLIEAEKSPDGFKRSVDEIYLPIAEALCKRFSRNSDRTGLVGLNGCPGSGKSTMALFLERLLHTEISLAVLSLDDFYLTRVERDQLARTLHPLFRSRGVPGTHDVSLIVSTIQSLRAAGSTTVTEWPRFDKASDDRCRRPDWNRFVGRPDLVLLEGWCVGLGPLAGSVESEPANDWEYRHDPEGTWRRFIEFKLSSDYKELFDDMDMLIVLLAPSLDIVFEWREEQEQKLRRARGGMDADEVREFLMPYLRLTQRMHQTLPAVADILVELSIDRTMRCMQWQQKVVA